MSPLISVAELNELLNNPRLVVIDCRFQLVAAPDSPNPGYLAYQEGHIPGAQYAHLDQDLSSEVVGGKTGRHPLPTQAQLEARLQDWGVNPDSILVCYDSSGGAFALRLWWLMKWYGFEQILLLDGGWQAWLQHQGAVTQDVTQPPRGTVTLGTPNDWVITASDIQSHPDHFQLIDARSEDRYRGENETIDPLAGHIPGAFSAPFGENLGADGRFLSPERLRARFLPMMTQATPGHYCGSGVTACHNWFAMTLAGLNPGKLYAGSWSDWITQPDPAIETGKPH